MFYALLNPYGNRCKSTDDILVAFDSRADRDYFVYQSPDYRQPETRADARREYSIEDFKILPDTDIDTIECVDSKGFITTRPFINRK